MNSIVAYSFYPTHDEIIDYVSVLEETNPPLKNHVISVYYGSLDDVWCRNKMIIDDALAYVVATKVMWSDDIKPLSVNECQRRTDWSNWKHAIQVELNLLAKRKVFGPVASIPPHVKPIGYKWFFVQKCNEKNEIVRYKARLVMQGFSQRPGLTMMKFIQPLWT